MSTAPVKLRTAALPVNANTSPYQFGAPVREAAGPLRAAFTRQLRDAKGSLRGPLLQAAAVLTFPDRRGRLSRSYEPVLRAALTAALEDVGAGVELRGIDVEVVEGGKRRPSTTVELRSTP